MQLSIKRGLPAPSSDDKSSKFIPPRVASLDLHGSNFANGPSRPLLPGAAEEFTPPRVARALDEGGCSRPVGLGDFHFHCSDRKVQEWNALSAFHGRYALLICGLVGLVLLSTSPAVAEDRLEATTTWYQEGRKGALGGLTVIHPQFTAGTDVGEHVSIGLGYSADAVTGATSTVYSVDAVSSATTFSDLRHAGNLALGFRGSRSRVTFNAALGTERDYLSMTFGGDASVDLPGRNTTLGLSYSHSFDDVCDRDHGDATPLQRKALTGALACAKQNGIFGKDSPGVTRWQSLGIDTAQATLTQNLTTKTNIQVSLFGQILRGLQSNPYRRVRIGPNEPQEFIPNARARVALTGRLNRFLPALNGAAHVDVRAYSDTWGVNSGAVELAYSQYGGSSLLLRIRARISQQTAATFFKDAFFYETESTAGSYFTGDRELAPVQNALIGAKLTVISVGEDSPVWGLFDKLQFNLKGDLMRFRELAADDPSANPMGRANQFLGGGSLVDAIVLQLGLIADY
jgi:hypothetical protein